MSLLTATGNAPSRYKSLGDYWTLITGAYPSANPGGVVWAAAVSQAESGGQPAIVSGVNSNGTVDIGLWQINSSHIGQTIGGVNIPSQAWLQDPNNNLRAAYALSNGFTNWTPWCTAWSDGACGTKGGRAPTSAGPAPGSPADRIAASWAGAAVPLPTPVSPAPPGSPQPAPPGTGGRPAGTCVISLGSFGCLLGSEQADVLLGGAALAAGALIILGGAALIALGTPVASSAARAAIRAVPGGGVVAGAARRTQTARAKPARYTPEETRRRATDADDRLHDERAERESREAKESPEGREYQRNRAAAKRATAPAAEEEMF